MMIAAPGAVTAEMVAGRPRRPPREARWPPSTPAPAGALRGGPLRAGPARRARTPPRGRPSRRCTRSSPNRATRSRASTTRSTSAIPRRARRRGCGRSCGSPSRRPPDRALLPGPDERPSGALSDIRRNLSEARLGSTVNSSLRAAARSAAAPSPPSSSPCWPGPRRSWRSAAVGERPLARRPGAGPAARRHAGPRPAAAPRAAGCGRRAAGVAAAGRSAVSAGSASTTWRSTPPSSTWTPGRRRCWSTSARS